MRYAYELQYQQLIDGEFKTYSREFYSSKAEANKQIDISLDVNNAYAIGDMPMLVINKKQKSIVLRAVNFNSNANSEGKCVRYGRVLTRHRLI